MGNNEKTLKKHDEAKDKHIGIWGKPIRNRLLEGHKLTFTEYLVKISKSIDKKIVSQERKRKMAFAGGLAKFSVDKPENKVKFAIEYYY